MYVHLLEKKLLFYGQPYIIDNFDNTAKTVNPLVSYNETGFVKTRHELPNKFNFLHITYSSHADHFAIRTSSVYLMSACQPRTLPIQNTWFIAALVLRNNLTTHYHKHMIAMLDFFFFFSKHALSTVIVIHSF